jgi:hypothetical protein
MAGMAARTDHTSGVQLKSELLATSSRIIEDEEEQHILLRKVVDLWTQSIF